MSRPHRSYLPGAVFHLTTRTQGREPWFTEGIRDTIVEYAATAFAQSDALLLAWAVMPNHLHFVMRQGRWTLGRVLHGLLHRTALLVRRCHGVEGHVFERRFRDRACQDPEHVRSSILYTHLNPVRAGIVNDLRHYRWTSHRMYLDEDAGPRCMKGVLRTYAGLELFAPDGGTASDELRAAYDAAVRRRMEADKARAGDCAAPVPAPSHGRWSVSFGPLFRAPAGRPPAPRRGDLDAIAARTLAAVAPAIALDEARSGSRVRAVVAARRELILRLGDAGFAGVAIARYFRVSPQCVSSILTKARSGR